MEEGELESYFEIDIGALTLRSRGSRGSWEVSIVSKGITAERADRLRKVSIPKSKRRRASWISKKPLHAAKEQMEERPGVALSIGAPGERGDPAWIPEDILRKHGPVMARDNDSLRLGASVAHAVGALHGRKRGHRAAKRFKRIKAPLQNARFAARPLQECGVECKMRKLPKSKRESFSSDRFR